MKSANWAARANRKIVAEVKWAPGYFEIDDDTWQVFS